MLGIRGTSPKEHYLNGGYCNEWWYDIDYQLEEERDELRKKAMSERNARLMHQDILQDQEEKEMKLKQVRILDFHLFTFLFLLLNLLYYLLYLCLFAFHVPVNLNLSLFISSQCETISTFVNSFMLYLSKELHKVDTHNHVFLVQSQLKLFPQK